MKDALGQEIEVGREAIWHRHHTAMHTGKVFEVLPVMVRMNGRNGHLVHPNVLVQVPADADRKDKLEGAIRFLLCFFEPDKHPYLDTNALKNAVAAAKFLVGQT